MLPLPAAAAVVVVPIRMGGGTRLKVVEGLAMGKAMVSTTLGCEGIDVRDGSTCSSPTTPRRSPGAVAELLRDPASGGRAGTARPPLMEEEYSWEIAGTRLGRAVRARHEPVSRLTLHASGAA